MWLINANIRGRGGREREAGDVVVDGGCEEQRGGVTGRKRMAEALGPDRPARGVSRDMGWGLDESEGPDCVLGRVKPGHLILVLGCGHW